MLTTPATVFLAALMGAAAASEPVTGAFGLAFDEPVTDDVLAASLGRPPYPLPPANLDQTVPEPVPGDPPAWFLFVPQAVPELLDVPGVTFMVLRNQTGYPVRILAEHPHPDCAEDLLWLTRRLARKYGADDDPLGAERAGFSRSARFTSERGQVDVSCGPRLLIEYTDPPAYDRWLTAVQERRGEVAAERALLAKEMDKLTRERLRRLANLFTAGDRYRVEGALGVRFGEAVPKGWFDAANVVADEPLSVHVPALPAPVRDGEITVTVGPDLMPVSIVGEFDDPDASRFEQLSQALEAKYGSPLKDTPIHRIHKISGDYLVARYLPDRAATRLVFIDDEGRQAQRAREKAEREARLAAQQQQFEEETAGL